MPSRHQDYEAGEIVPFHFNAGIIVASFFVSLSGTVTTVELLHRRQVGASWVQLAACSTTFALAGIFAMHFVGNRSIIMAHGELSLQLTYSAGFTVLSSIIPLLCLFLAFLVSDLRYRGRAPMAMSLTASGLGSGFAIAGMHYTGNAALSPTYSVSYDISYILGAIILACATSLIAIAGVFVLQHLWISKLVFRLLCASLLATAVTAFHYVAVLGTSYHLVSVDGSDASGRDVNVIIAAVICVSTIPICIFIVWSASQKRRATADTVKQIKLAAAVFDRAGNILVTQQCHLPRRLISTHGKITIFEGEVSTSLPLFQWLLQASYNWSVVSRWLYPMTQHLEYSVKQISLSSQDQGYIDSFQEALDTNQIALLKEKFCIAAADLAIELQRPLESIGHLHDKTMFTGVFASCEGAVSRSGFRKSDETQLDETQIVGSGQVLFLVSKVSEEEASILVAKGYRFVNFDDEKVKARLVKVAQAPKLYVEVSLANLKATAFSAQRPNLHGTMLCAFILKPGVRQKKWEVLVQKHRVDRVPFVQLAGLHFDESYQSALRAFHGMCISDCLRTLRNANRGGSSQYSKAFLRQFNNCILALQRSLPASMAQTLIFHGYPVHATNAEPRASMATEAQSAQTTSNEFTLYAFHTILDIHGSETDTKDPQNLVFTPFSLFRSRQILTSNPSHYEPFSTSFERELVREFGQKFSLAVSRDGSQISSSVHSLASRAASHAKACSSLFSATPFRSRSQSVTSADFELSTMPPTPDVRRSRSYSATVTDIVKHNADEVPLANKSSEFDRSVVVKGKARATKERTSKEAHIEPGIEPAGRLSMPNTRPPTLTSGQNSSNFTSRKSSFAARRFSAAQTEDEPSNFADELFNIVVASHRAGWESPS